MYATMCVCACVCIYVCVCKYVCVCVRVLYMCVFVYACPIGCVLDVCTHEGLLIIYCVMIGKELTCTVGARCGTKRRHAQPVAKKLSKATPRVKMAIEILDSCNWIECDRIPWGCAVN